MYIEDLHSIEYIRELYKIKIDAITEAMKNNGIRMGTANHDFLPFPVQKNNVGL
ncbi:MAG: hypothetical protein LBH44_01540 [Treponema sp.]|nr:hypothetical protein [Treponema sp.]